MSAFLAIYVASRLVGWQGPIEDPVQCVAQRDVIRSAIEVAIRTGADPYGVPLAADKIDRLRRITVDCVQTDTKPVFGESKT